MKINNIMMIGHTKIRRLTHIMVKKDITVKSMMAMMEKKMKKRNQMM